MAKSGGKDYFGLSWIVSLIAVELAAWNRAITIYEVITVSTAMFR